MSDQESDNNAAKIKEEYRAFVRKRCQETNYHAAEKLQQIEELSEIIQHARDSYLKKKK